MEKLTYSKAKRYRAQKVDSDSTLLLLEPLIKSRVNFIESYFSVFGEDKTHKKDLVFYKRVLRQIRAIKAERTVFEQDTKETLNDLISRFQMEVFDKFPDAELFIDGNDGRYN